MKVIIKILFSMLVPALWLAGCMLTNGVQAEESVPVEKVFSGRHCKTADKEFQARWVNDPEQTASIAGWPQSPADPNDLSQWNPKNESRLWIQMGRKPTGGFSLDLAGTKARIRNGVATVVIQWREPAADAFVTQVITSPCLVLKIGNGRYHTIQIQDQHGNIRAQLEKPGK